MFPLGSVLFPAMPLPLRVFEDRYVTMLNDLLAQDVPEFAVVLIERGQEVGGGDHRFDVGTVARVTEVAAGDGFVHVLAVGERRVAVQDWLPDTPYPRASVEVLPELTWDDALEPRREQTELLVRRTLARASEFNDHPWPPDVQLADDPIESLWQLAAIAPLGPLDQIGLLRAESTGALIDALFVATTDAGEQYGR